MKSGIYIITCIYTNKVYIGSAVNTAARFYVHRSKLNNNIHHCIKLQNAWNKYGKDSFEFEVLESCNREDLIRREQYYLDTLLFAQEFIRGEDKRFEELSFNINPIAGSSLGRRWMVSEEGRKNMAASKVGSKNHRYGKKLTEEHRLKLLQINIGKPQSKEARLKNSKANSGEKNGFFGKKHSKEVRKVMSEKAKQRYKNKLING